jgi:nicotinamidase-related amidase
MSKVSPHFKPASNALLLIDYQVGTMQLIRNQMPDTSLRNAIALAKTALAFSMPIVLTSSQEDHLQGPIAKSLQHVLPEQFAARVQRVGVVNAWDDPGFKKAVEATGRRQLIMGAVTTDICLVFPAISAVEDGYEVQAVMDASGSSFAIGEETSRRRMERSGVWLTSTNTMIAELVQDWSTTEGQKLMPLMMADVAIHPVD